MMNGCLLVQSYAARQSAPVPGVTVTIRGEGHAPVTLTTDETGTAPVIQLPAPDKALSLDEANTQQPYSLWDVTAEKEGYQTVTMQGVQVFACQTALILLEMLPAQRLRAPAKAGELRHSAPFPLPAPGALQRGPGPKLPGSAGAGHPHRAHHHHGASGQAQGKRPQCNGELPALHRQRGLQRGLPHLAGRDQTRKFIFHSSKNSSLFFGEYCIFIEIKVH